KAEARRLQFEKSYQVTQALISVGSGGLLGKGWCKGDQTALGFLPPGAAHNDFIFSVIAEEEGFVGSILVLTLYAVVLFTGLRIAGQARDRLGKLVAVGVVTLIFSHVFINIGMNTRIVPVTGIPLPLLSYGGGSLLLSLISLGLLQNNPDRDATQARADVVAEQGGDERLFEKRHTHEIERAENIAAGLPAESAEKPQTPVTIP